MLFVLQWIVFHVELDSEIKLLTLGIHQNHVATESVHVPRNPPRQEFDIIFTKLSFPKRLSLNIKLGIVLFALGVSDQPQIIPPDLKSV